MITKAELEKMVEDGAEKKYPDTDNHWHQIALNGFKSGASFVTGILMTEQNKTVENIPEADGQFVHVSVHDELKAELARYEELYQLAKSEDFKLACGPLTASIEFCKHVAMQEEKRADQLKNQLSEASARIDKMMNAHLDSSKEWSGIVNERDATIQSLKDEIEVLRRYGNKDCTAMADEALTQKAEE